MKKLILVAVLLLTVSALSFGQSAVANVSATVNPTISITRLTDLAIGNVAQGGTVTVLSTAAGAASFQVAGAVSALTTIAIVTPTNLTFGAIDLPFTPQMPRYNVVAGAAGSTAFGSLTGGQTSSSGVGALFVYVGGGVTAGASQAAGSYTGTITASVTQP